MNKNEQVVNKIPTDNIQEVLDQLSTATEKAVEDRLKKYEFIHDIDINLDILNIVEKVGDTIYCEKTGAILKIYSAPEIKTIINSCGKERAFEAMIHALKPQIAPHWLFTDPKALDKLSETDPIGYFVYASTRVFISQEFSTNNPNIETNIAKIKNNKNKYLLRYDAQRLPIKYIVAANEIMRQYLTITKTSKAMRFITFDELNPHEIAKDTETLTNFCENLRNTLHKIIKYEQSRGKLKQYVTYDEIIALRLKYKGRSNFAGQRKLKQLSNVEHYEMLLHDFFPDEVKPFTVELQAREEERKIKAMEIAKKGVVPSSLPKGKIVFKFVSKK